MASHGKDVFVTRYPISDIREAREGEIEEGTLGAAAGPQCVDEK